MENEELRAEMLVSDLKHNDALIKEFDHLRPKWWQPFANLCRFAIFTLGLILLFPEAKEHPIIYVLLILVFGQSIESVYSNSRTNKRIDILKKCYDKPSSLLCWKT